jgi:lipopolysaccharide transport system ATP-binding protein
MLAVGVEGLSKCYALYRSPRDRLLEWLSLGRRVRHRPFWALREVSFAVTAGGALGVIGANGAGKSTLLGILAGTIQPTSGRVAVEGRVSALLELGAGFHPDFSGRDNVHLAAAVLGLSREEIEAKYPAIAEFAGLGEFMDQPVRTYSSGMFVRLAFSVATCVDPDVLVVDEVLAVGDQEFQRRCTDRIERLRRGGTTLVVCSHNLYLVRQLCSTALWLDHGRVVELGDPVAVTDAYMSAERGRSAVSDRPVPAEPAPVAGSAGPGPGEAGGRPETPAAGPEAAETGPRLHRIQAVDGAGHPATQFTTGGFLGVEVQLRLPPAWEEEPTVGVAVLRNDQLMVYGLTTEMEGVALRPVAPDRREIALEMPELPLLAGEYTVSAFLFDATGVHLYERQDRAWAFSVRNPSREVGVCRLGHRWR